MGVRGGGGRGWGGGGGTMLSFFWERARKLNFVAKFLPKVQGPTLLDLLDHRQLL